MLSILYTKSPTKETVTVTFEGKTILEKDSLDVRDLWTVIEATGIPAGPVSEATAGHETPAAIKVGANCISLSVPHLFA